MPLSFRNAIQSGQALKKKLAGLFSFSAIVSPKNTHTLFHSAGTLSLFITITAFCVLTLAGCGKKSSDASFMEQLDLIDACILNGQYADAVTLTDKAADNAIGLERQLSIVKRYTKLGETQKMRVFIEKAIKKQPEVPELNAIYANILLAEGDVLNAVKYTDLLSNTKWSPLYTEVILRRAVADNIFMDGNYTDFFVRAAGATQNEQWLVDAAVVEARRGNFRNAASITPVMPETEQSAYFWALINYEAGNYLECVDLCALCGSIPDAALLASDAWLMAGENKAADDYWLSIINSVSGSASAGSPSSGASGTTSGGSGKGSATISGASANTRKNSIPKEIYCNAALYAVRSDDLVSAYRILVDMVSKYPDFDNGLVVYADYALKTSGSMITEPYSVLSTLQQQKQREIPAIPVSDALYRMETSLSKEFRSPLYVEYLRTKWLSGGSSPIACRQDILLALERYRADGKYEQYLADFAICWMLRNYYDAEAEGFFYDYMAEKYALGAASFAENAALFDDRECMLAAWFRLKNGFVDDAKTLYESYVYDRGCMKDTVAAVNLAAIYNAFGLWQKAIELYGTLAGTTDDSELASEIHYRMGYIQASHNDKKNALLSLSYSVKLNPDNNKARLLLKTLQ